MTLSRTSRLLFGMILILAAGVPLTAESTWCEDCTKRVERDEDGNIVAEEGLCCMADYRGRCYGGFSIVTPNVGWDCIIQATSLGTQCITFNRDTNCGSSDAGGGSDDPDDQTGECVYQDGICPAQCASCTW
jgi:hypothetical protein